MTRRRRAFNPKRRIKTETRPAELEELVDRVSYGGNPEHKKNPGDFGLSPPAQPRPDKTLCDEAGVFKTEDAKELLKQGIRKGLVSEQMRGGYPRNVWAVTGDGIPLEAQLDNEQQGNYHGYPMPSTDPFRDLVLSKWEKP